MDIFESLRDIPALREFNAEPPALDIAPISQRVREFLAGLFGGGWYGARVLEYATAKGERVYAAIGPAPDFGVLHLVCEREDGILSLAAPVDLAEEDTLYGMPGNILIAPVQTQAEDKEQSCLDVMLPALRDAVRVVTKADISEKRKARILAQLVHAMQHLAE